MWVLPFPHPLYQAFSSVPVQVPFTMAGKALSEYVKRQMQCKLKETKLLEAVDTYHNEQLKPHHSRCGLHEIARLHGIPDQWNNIGKRYNGVVLPWLGLGIFNKMDIIQGGLL